MSTKTALKRALKIIPKSKMAKQFNPPIAYQSITYWMNQNRMPRTEFSGETNWSRQIQDMTDGQVTVEDLLGSVPPHQA